MATPEGKVKDKIKATCKARGAYYAMPVMNGMASNGTPDFLICYKGCFIAVEAKAGKGKATALQLVRLREILSAGGAPLIINEENIDSLAEVFDAIDDGFTRPVVDENFKLLAFGE
jgi:NADPH:quinone reductase-like Zn-dependent oxidoreductase